jgi:hypothetical protein
MRTGFIKSPLFTFIELYSPLFTFIRLDFGKTVTLQEVGRFRFASALGGLPPSQGSFVDCLIGRIGRIGRIGLI